MTLFEPYLWIRFCNVWATCAVRRARSSQRRAGHVEHLPRRAQVTFCQTSHVQIGWERFHSRDSGRRRWQAGDVYGTGDTRPGVTRWLQPPHWPTPRGLVLTGGCWGSSKWLLQLLLLSFNKPIRHLLVGVMSTSPVQFCLRVLMIVIMIVNVGRSRLLK